MARYCCVKCFAYEWLRNYVLETSDKIGDCDYCGRKEIAIIPLHVLYQPFENLIELYVPSNDQNGEFLIDLIQADYEIFEDEFYADGDAAKLLGDITYSGWDDDSGESPVDPHELYYHRSSSWYHTTMREAWEEFCYNIKENPTHELNLPDSFDEDLARLETELPRNFSIFRARIGFQDDELGRPRPFEGIDIGAPPPNSAKAGRANSEGQVVLYAADQEPTAISEVRPWRGLLVSVAELILSQSLRLVNLSAPPPPSNPFTDEAPQYELELEDLLISFGMELGRPLRRADYPQDYLPSQKLVRRIQGSSLYDGIRYPSAIVPSGTNLVIFDPNLVRIGSSKLVEIGDFEIPYSPFVEEQ